MNAAIRAREDFDPISRRRDFYVLFQGSDHLPKGVSAPKHLLEVEFNRIHLTKGDWLQKQPTFGSGKSARPVNGFLNITDYPDGAFFQERIAWDHNPQVRVFVSRDRRPRSIEAYDLVRRDEERVLVRTGLTGKLHHRLMMMALQFARKLAVHATGELWLDCLVLGRNEDAHLYVCGVARTRPAPFMGG